MFRSRSKTTNAEALKVKTDALMQQALKDAKKQIKNGELIDCRSFELCLRSIDAKYDYLRADIKDSTHIADYLSIRAEKIAETRQLLEFYEGDRAELTNLYRIVGSKAKQAGRVDDITQDRVQPPDMNRLKKSFDKLTDDGDKLTDKEYVNVRQR